jgi:non-specific protein-tyrosine kinase
MSRLKKALEKAKQDQPNIQLRNIENQETREYTNVEALKPPRQEVKITYSKTKVQPVSLDSLEKSKIFAPFAKYKISDQIKTMRSQVLKKMMKLNANTIMITSANPGEGKTFTSINLGISIAQELDKTVLIIDADLKNPTRDHYDFATDFFNIDIKTGLADVLQGRIDLDDALVNPGIEKLTILPGGQYLESSAELLGSPQMEQLVMDVRTRYKNRIVIFDTPALLKCADPVQLSRFVETVLFVVEEEKTTSENIKQSLSLLSDIEVIGMILNKSKVK